MEKQSVKNALAQLRTNLVKRNFTQSVDFVINLKDLDLKKPEQQVDLFVSLPHGRGKAVKVGALVGAELTPQAKENCDLVITNEDFVRFHGNKKEIKKLARKCDFFIAQANIMPEVAKVFGSVLGPRKKMPNPKAGCVVPPNANLKPVIEKLKKLVRASAKTEYSVKCTVGLESFTDDQLTDNILAVYSAVISALPNEENNVKNIAIKTSMGKPVKVSQSAVEAGGKK